MGDPRFLALASKAIGKFATDNETVEHIVRRLHETGDYEFFYVQWTQGMTDRRVVDNLKARIMGMGYDLRAE